MKAEKFGLSSHTNWRGTNENFFLWLSRASSDAYIPEPLCTALVCPFAEDDFLEDLSLAGALEAGSYPNFSTTSLDSTHCI